MPKSVMPLVVIVGPVLICVPLVITYGSGDVMVVGGPNSLGGAVGDGDGPGVLVMLGFEAAFRERTFMKLY